MTDQHRPEEAIETSYQGGRGELTTMSTTSSSKGAHRHASVSGDMMPVHHQLHQNHQQKATSSIHGGVPTVYDDFKDEENTMKEAQSSGAPGEGGGMTLLVDMLGPAYARNVHFWKALLFSSVLQGFLLAFIALGFFNAYIFVINNTWLTEDYEDALNYRPNPLTRFVAVSRIEDIITNFTDLGGNSTNVDEILEPLALGAGPWWYVALLAGAGLGVGLIKLIWSQMLPQHAWPDKVPTFVDDVRELKSHDVLLPIPMMLCSILSIGMGACVGPEAAMGAAGTAVGSLLSRKWKIFGVEGTKATDDDKEEDGEKKSFLSKLLPDFSEDDGLCALDGLSAAFGALLPAQYLSTMLLWELGGHWGPGGRFDFMETMARSGVAATVAYAVFTGFADQTLLEQMSIPIAAYDFAPNINTVDLAYGAILGIICGVVGFIGFILLGLGIALGKKTTEKFNKLGAKCGLGDRTLGLVLAPTLGGALTGLLCVAAPLILGDGSHQLSTVISLASELGTTNLVVTAILKMIALGISYGFGMVGGQIFPLIFVGSTVGSIVHQLVPEIPFLLALPTCMVAVPTAFTPAIFTLTTTASMLIALGGAATTPVFVACVFSYTSICGLGLVQGLIKKLVVKQAAAEGAEVSEAPANEPGFTSGSPVEDRMSASEAQEQV